MLEEDLDDTHLCIKCSATIVGLNNYVQHRKTNCSSKTSRNSIVGSYAGYEYQDSSNYAKSEVETTGGKTSKNITDPYELPYEPAADLFFSSLQLQSVQASSGGKTSSNQQILTRKATATLLSSSGRDEPEGDWQEETPNNTENLMKAVRDISETKKFEPIFKPIAFGHGSPEPEQSDDDDDVDEVFDDDDDDDDEDYVPTPYSGGKWKPGSQPAPRSGGKWKNKTQPTAVIPASHTGGKWNFKIPANEGSKWKPYARNLQADTSKVSTSSNQSSQISEKPKSTAEYLSKEPADDVQSSDIPETGGKWKPGFRKVSSGAKWKSTEGQEPLEILEPQTGGKWKPGGSKSLKIPPPSFTGGKWKSAEGSESPDVIESHTGGKWKPGQRPFTEECRSGKWKPGDRQTKIKGSSVLDQWDDQEPWEDVSETHPPVEHTKGKWVPGTKVERLEYKEEALPPPQDFWCNICCRKLKTKTIYEKHLRSGVHMRKSETEQQLERAAIEQLELSRSIPRPTPMLLERTVSPESNPNKRKRRKTFIKCEICKHRMQRYLVGKHLISHYHYVRMTLNPERSYTMILDNIHQIVLQSPFQCRPCQFYANTEENFLIHWNSVEHRDRTEGPGKFWCSFCHFECEDNNQMRRHLLGTDHREVILAINRSVPIHITKKVTIDCSKCHQGFRFNMELRQHAMRCEGAKVIPIGTASDEYQSRFRCNLCPDEVLKSKTALQRHEKFKHNKPRYFCSVCGEDFESAAKAVKHRKTKAHRDKSAEKLFQMKRDAKMKSRKEISTNLQCTKCGHMSSSEVEAMLHQITHPEGCPKNKEKPQESLSLMSVKEEPIKTTNRDVRKCHYCSESFKTKAELKSHLNAVHPEIKHICPLCGEAFTLPQELGSHRRYKICVASTSKQTPTSSSPSPKKDPTLKKSWNCSDCTFRSVYESELIFHRIIHTDGLQALETDEKLSCPLCEKSFTKHSLRHHLRQHTNEKTFTCEICKRSFSRRHNYKEHMQYVHLVGGAKQRKRGRSTDESFICDTCGKIFRTKYSLKMHINIHTKRDKKFLCPVEHCQYVGRNRTTLSMHSNTHMVKMEFKCQEQDCKYQGKSAYHLKRHMKNHLEPGKIYKCPECDFKAKIPGHIKRHVRMHTGECPYKCPHCDYSCGYVENLRKHILTTKKHPGKFIYQCTQCDPASQYRTNYNNEYQLHLTTAHPP